jgi:hypothetical protein
MKASSIAADYREVRRRPPATHAVNPAHASSPANVPGSGIVVAGVLSTSLTLSIVT